VISISLVQPHGTLCRPINTISLTLLPLKMAQECTFRLHASTATRMVLLTVVWSSALQVQFEVELQSLSGRAFQCLGLAV